MSWQAVLSIIASEVGDEAASRIEDKIRSHFGGQRIRIRKTKIITVKLIDNTAPGKPKEAAKRLGVHLSTVYRALNKPIIR